MISLTILKCSKLCVNIYAGTFYVHIRLLPTFELTATCRTTNENHLMMLKTFSSIMDYYWYEGQT